MGVLAYCCKEHELERECREVVVEEENTSEEEVWEEVSKPTDQQDKT